MFQKIISPFIFIIIISLVFVSCSNPESKKFPNDSEYLIISFDLMKDEKPITQEDIDLFLILQPQYVKIDHAIEAEKKLFYPYGLSRTRFYYIAIKLLFCWELYHDMTTHLEHIPPNIIPSDEDKKLFEKNRLAYEEVRELKK